MKKCQFCAEEIQDEAIKCKHCGSDLLKQEVINKSASAKAEKPKIGALASFFLAGFISFIFLFVSVFIFLQDVSGLSFEQKADMGQVNLWRTVILFGFFSLATTLLSIKFKRIRTVPIFLWIFWACGSTVVVLLSMNTSLPPIASNNNPGRLKQRFEEMEKLVSDGNLLKIYDDFYSIKSKKKVKRDFFTNSKFPPRNDKAITIGNKKVLSVIRETGNIITKGNISYVDGTATYCFDKNCEDNQVSRRYYGFVYENNDWFWDKDTGVCIRESGYDMPEEFKRAISLIIQRLEQSNDTSLKYYADEIAKVSNCLNIQYANSDQEMAGAEGFFMFSPAQSLDAYDIKISPKYSVKDDLITAVLLSHEINHVVHYINNNIFLGDQEDCFGTEANAFVMQNTILSVINKEEFNSLVTRVSAGKSLEATQLIDVYITIPKYPGKDYHEKALNFVKSSPFYQKECKDR